MYILFDKCAIYRSTLNSSENCKSRPFNLLIWPFVVVWLSSQSARKTIFGAALSASEHI